MSTVGTPNDTVATSLISAPGRGVGHCVKHGRSFAKIVAAFGVTAGAILGGFAAFGYPLATIGSEGTALASFSGSTLTGASASAVTAGAAGAGTGLASTALTTGTVSQIGMWGLGAALATLPPAVLPVAVCLGAGLALGVGMAAVSWVGHQLFGGIARGASAMEHGFRH